MIARKPGTWRKPKYRKRSQTREYRPKALKHYGPKCQGCGFEEHVKLLDVNHIDNNPTNNALENLQVLCVMCHAKVTRLGYRF